MLRCVRRHTGADCLPAHQVGQVWAVSSVCNSSLDRVTARARVPLKNPAPTFSCCLLPCGRKALSCHPSIENRPWLNYHADQHHCVLSTAKLRTLAEIDPCLVRIDPHRIDPVGDKICLAGQARDPKAMRDIRGLQLDPGWRGMCRIAERNMQFIRRDDSQIGIAQLPPPLMANHAT